MSMLKKKTQQLSCSVVGHDISEEEEDRLYTKPTDTEGIRKIESTCVRCKAKLELKVNPTDEDEYLVTGI